ncbi:MAG: thymidine phosphorylase, partial [Mycolicibacterium vanbaalenii]|uniref:thymidine phosphorylase n=1 Tax=Mycolicibacterium vanbaalenii TaxID=110539 RepID=UPI0035681AA1
MTQFTFDMPSVIRTKRDGGVLSDDAIDWVIDAYTHGRVAEAQMSALLMAIFLRGMTDGEIARWTAAMVDSGERLDFSDLRRDGKPLALVDKHSTGGVGDKITIPLVPVVMACGGAVPQAAGRGLGHTGGTLDKLESIPGFTAEISKAQIRQQLCELGAAIFAAGELAPADRKIYALRDVTATTESLPLIASSVMSKKIAEGTRALVLDTKVGSGAFLKTEAESRELARTMVELGTAHGVRTRALLTDMNTPLGRTVGNAVEVAESLEVLAGGGPDDVVELTLALAREMCDAAGLDGVDPAETLRDGTAMDRFRALVAAQGGDPDAALPLGAHSETVSAPRGGTMGDIDAMAVGLAVWRLGAGRSAPGEQVQFGAGMRIHRRPGEPVAAGEPLFTLYTDTPERLAG